MFFFEHGVLREHVVPKRGEPYVHSCTEQVFRAVVGWIDEHPDERFTLESVVAAEQLPNSAAAVAFRFLHAYGLIERCYPRMNRAVSDEVGNLSESALMCWHALREGVDPLKLGVV